MVVEKPQIEPQRLDLAEKGHRQRVGTEAAKQRRRPSGGSQVRGSDQGAAAGRHGKIAGEEFAAQLRHAVNAPEHEVAIDAAKAEHSLGFR